MHVSATDLKNHLGQYLSISMNEPVMVEKSGRLNAVLISYNEFQRLHAAEDHLLGLQALKAEQEGYIGQEQSTALLNNMRKMIQDGNKKN